MLHKLRQSKRTQRERINVIYIDKDSLISLITAGNAAIQQNEAIPADFLGIIYLSPFDFVPVSFSPISSYCRLIWSIQFEPVSSIETN